MKENHLFIYKEYLFAYCLQNHLHTLIYLLCKYIHMLAFTFVSKTNFVHLSIQL